MKKCPYCAEEIQDEAIKCKHCGAMLSHKARKSIIIILSILLIVIVGSLVVAKSKKTVIKQNTNPVFEKVVKDTPFKLFSKQGTISGHAYITLGSGESNILRGTSIYLIQDSQEFSERNASISKIQESVIEKITNIISSIVADLGRNYLFSITDISRSCGMISAGKGMAKRHMIESELFYSMSAMSLTKTSVEGEYKFENVPLGKYYIYAKYKTNFNEGYWIVPVSVEANNKLVNIDIDNNNLNNEREMFKVATLENTEEQLLRIARVASNEITSLQIKRLNIEAVDNIVRGQSEFDYPKSIVSKKQ